MPNMSDQQSSENHPPSWEGHRLQPKTQDAVREAIGHACDYRGDVTIHLTTGEQICGYVFDRQEEALHPYLKMYLADRADPFFVNYQDIVEVAFSGEDTAFGRSWEDWAKKWQKPQTS